MTKEYLKMTDAFKIGDGSTRSTLSESTINGTVLILQGGRAQYAVHAINSHDELVAEVERLRGSLKHANAQHELFERQYYLEKDDHEKLQAYVADLRHEISLLSNVLDEVDRVISERIKNGAYDLDDISAEVSQAIERLDRDTELMLT